ncbi:MAG: prepilin-type N-terminal cleavage/methylation domain-containing protein [Planctomycetota bacterium]|nr:MAG: prepilin-type N-terminal cleavage/methylation domain-containing protein [Planctomycetota bacterium]RLS95766.1 MAG: prepilin-type N-terminal cleavage/methylation domain-containing protein [Planctomycetota bacterium]
MHRLTIRASRIRSRASQRGFSLLEVMVVAALLALLAGMILPRMASVNRQRDETGIDSVADLLRMYAFRNSSMTQEIALWYDEESNVVSLWIKDIDAENPDGARIWHEDKLSMPVTLPTGMAITEALADGTVMTKSPWTIATRPDGSRPKIELRVQGETKESIIVLESWAVGPTRIELGEPSRSAIDLDNEGRGLERW